MIEFFTDPVLRAPTLASMLMCFASSLIGVLIFLKKKSLLAETLSHATYPGVALALMVATFFSFDKAISIVVLVGAFGAALLGFYAITFLEKKGRLKEDASLSFVLAAFFGFGVTLASFLQSSLPKGWQKAHSYLYGQVSTLTDGYILLYLSLAFFIVVTIILSFKEITIYLFDQNFAITSSRGVDRMETLFVILSSLAVVVGMRSCGLILVTAMLIAPAVFARAITDCLRTMFWLAGGVGLISAFLGNVISLKLSSYYHLSFPTGPLIVVVASTWAVLALLFSPKKGLVLRYIRIVNFRFGNTQDHILKGLWRNKKKYASFNEISQLLGISRFTLTLALMTLMRKKAIGKSQEGYFLTDLGRKLGGKIIRLHRLWEVYLADYLGVNVQKVHKSAEEIEHILTPELEKELTKLLDDPTHDPHDQPIPTEEEVRYA